MSPEQIAAGRSCSSWHNSFTETGDRDQLAAEAVCVAYLMRLGERWEKLSDTFMAA
jgi:hypothetical protein